MRSRAGKLIQHVRVYDHTNARAERNILCRKHYGKENRHKRKTDYPVLTHYHDRYGDNALASAEAEIERKGMTDNASEPRKGRAERAAEESAEKQDREHSLSRIADKGQNSGRLTVGTEHIGHAAVSGAMLAHIVAIGKARYDNAEIKAAEQICRNQRKHNADYLPCRRARILRDDPEDSVEPYIIKIKH